MIAIITPSRGLVFTETAEYVESLRRTYPLLFRHYMSHNLPIPDCFNFLVDQALNDTYPHHNPLTHLFFIEEDTIPPAGGFERMKAANASVAAIDYGFNGGWNTIVRSAKDNSIIFTGFGCTLVDVKVFEKLDRPFFRSDQAYNISSKTWYETDPYKVYGMFDIYFGHKVREKGFKIEQVEGECRHLQLNSLGQKEVNNGVHQISEKDRIARKIII